jgi:hypothetical protein
MEDFTNKLIFMNEYNFLTDSAANIASDLGTGRPRNGLSKIEPKRQDSCVWRVEMSVMM